MSQSDSGRHQIDIAEVEMPGLLAYRAESGPSNIPAFSHMTSQTSVLNEILAAFSATFHWDLPNTSSTQDHLAADSSSIRGYNAHLSALIVDKTTPGREYKVKDMCLAEFGRAQIDVAEDEMPALMACRAKFGPSQPLKGVKITGSLFVTSQTAVLIETLTTLGAEVRWCSSNTSSTQNHAAAAIARDSASVFAWTDENPQEYWWCTERALDWGPGGGPDLIVDAGGHATLLIHEGVKAEETYEKTGKFPDPASADNADFQIVLTIISDGLKTDPKRYYKMKERLVGVSEETDTGFKWLYQMQANGTSLFPAIDVNDSVTKSKVELTNLLHAVQETMAEMSALNQLMYTRVLQQAQHIKRLHEQVVEAKKDAELVDKEVSEAMQRNGSSRTLLLMFLFVLTFSIIFLDWFHA